MSGKANLPGPLGDEALQMLTAMLRGSVLVCGAATPDETAPDKDGNVTLNGHVRRIRRGCVKVGVLIYGSHVFQELQAQGLVTEEGDLTEAARSYQDFADAARRVPKTRRKRQEFLKRRVYVNGDGPPKDNFLPALAV